MRSASALSLSAAHARRHHVAGLPWTTLLRWACWLALLLAPAAVLFHYEVTVAAPARADTEQVLRQVDADHARAEQALQKIEENR